MKEKDREGQTAEDVTVIRESLHSNRATGARDQRRHAGFPGLLMPPTQQCGLVPVGPPINYTSASSSLGGAENGTGEHVCGPKRLQHARVSLTPSHFYSLLTYTPK